MIIDYLMSAFYGKHNSKNNSESLDQFPLLMSYIILHCTAPQAHFFLPG